MLCQIKEGFDIHVMNHVHVLSNNRGCTIQDG